MVVPRSKVPNMVSGRTLVKSTIWSHAGRKYRIEIFGHRMAETGWKWCDVCKPPSVPETVFAYLAQIVFFILKCRLIRTKSANAVPGMEGGLHTSRLLQPVLAALRPKILIRYFRPGCDQMSQIRKFWLGKSISLWNFTPVGHKVSLQDFYPFWPPYGPKFQFGTFDLVAARWVKCKNFDLQRAFCFGTLRQWCVKFLSMSFSCFGHPMDENFDPVPLTRVRPETMLGTFSQWCD